MSSLCGAGALAREKTAARIVKANARAVLAVIAHAFAVLAEMMKEIFDESAYRRFLDRSRLESSPDAYAIFRKENEQAKAQKLRCC
jgi:hypothetical protein